MREPDVVVHEWQGPRAALHVMDSHGIDEVFLIARDSTLRGILTEEQVEALASQQVRTLEGVEVTPALTTSPDTYIEDIIPIAAQSRHPVAVVADNGSLLGEIRRGALLSGMSSSE